MDMGLYLDESYILTTPPTTVFHAMTDIMQSYRSIHVVLIVCMYIAAICSPIPRCVFTLAYRAVPVRFLFSLYAICWCVRLSLYFLAKPKSMIYTRLPFLPRPMRKLSGLMSLCIKFFEWIYSMRLICNRENNRLIWWLGELSVILIVEVIGRPHTNSSPWD